ncbi:hypothetical protein PR202_ga25895 [Eleusine coracana subsp. coracana]|uniref:Uncharacterized protein n=1 Tax=Eleusine coracana subsp. coracana TaxID=191504 RepID=A0AAV5DC56_ELECO|nr:hypothetical protein PR202_ga25895 [Eleusine coracana subsp. coracana]
MAMGLPGLRCCGLAARGWLPSLGPALRCRRSPCVPALRYSSLQAPAGDRIGEEVLRMFLEERQLHGDFVTKIADVVWRRDTLEATEGLESAVDVAGTEDVGEDVTDEGVLRLAATREWVSGESDLPLTKRLSAKDRQDDSVKRKELNLLKYEALKDELLLLTTGIGAACSLYCLLVFSFELSLLIIFSYANARIGIRSEDLKSTIEKTLGGTSVALSSPRLVIPAMIFGLSALSDHFQNSIFSFELVPGMMGFLAYKAAALVQVYRDNEDLRLILPEEEDADRS